MNKKQAIAYAQIALETMLRSDYKNSINIQNLGLEMKQAFKLYTRDMATITADSMIYAETKLQDLKNGFNKNNGQIKKS